MADNKIIEEVFKTIDIITDHKLNMTEYLYTEDCTIIAKTADPFLYKVQHEQQEFDAHSPLGESFEIGQTVTVLFTDYSKITKKIILFGSATSKKLASIGALNSFFIEGSEYFYNGITYGNFIPSLKFLIDTSTLGNLTSYFDLQSDIRILNPIRNNQTETTAIKFHGYFGNGSNYIDAVYTQIPNLMVTKINTPSYSPIQENVIGAYITSGGYNQFFSFYDTLDVGLRYANNYLTKFWYNDGSGAGASFVGGIYTNGSSISLAYSSDYRLKDNVAPLSEGLNKINALNPISWDWKGTGAYGEGFLAHEVQEVIPTAVIGEKDQVDEGKDPIYQQIDLTKLIPTLVLAIKELSAEVSLLKQEIQMLKEGDTINGP